MQCYYKVITYFGTFEPKSKTIMDLLGSILGTMQKPPTMGDEERKKAKGSLTFICCSSNLFNQLLIKEHNEDLHIKIFQILFTSRI